MDKYKNFSLEDFLQDEFFNKWVQNPFSTEAAVWEDWLIENSEMQDVVDEAKSILIAFNNQPKQLSENFYVNIKSRIDTTLHQEKKQQQAFYLKRGWLQFAAVFIALSVSAFFLFHSSPENNFITYSSNYGETKKVVLPDGSEVTLNAHSSLQYKLNNNKNGREVWLKGEGFFFVKHAEEPEKNPVKFMVHTNNVTVEVLGTRFNVNSNEGDITAVLLTKGKVRLSGAEGVEPVNMQLNELAVYNNKTRLLHVNKVNPGNYISWMEHKYIFEKITIDDLSKELYRYYGKSFTYRDVKMGKQRLSGTLELQDEQTLMRTLSALLGVPVNEKGNHIIIGSE